MKRILNWFHSLRFRSKIALSHISVALIPFLLFASVSTAVLFSQVQRTAVAHTEQITGQVSNSIDVYIGTLDKMSDYVARLMMSNGMLENRAGWMQSEAMLRQTLRNIAASHSEIAGILVVTAPWETADEAFVSTGMSRISKDPFSGEYWYQEAVAHPDKLVLISSATGRNIETNTDYSVDDVFSMAKAVTDGEGVLRGVVMFDVRHAIIQDSINQVTIGENGFVFVLDDKDNIVYAPANSVVYRVNPVWLSSDRVISADIGAEQYQISTRESAYTGWRVVGVFPLQEILSSFGSIGGILLVCVVVAAAFVLMFSLHLSRTVTKPISKLQGLMKKAESGDLSVRFNSLYHDEIGKLGQSFNHMIVRMDALIQQVYKEQRLKRDAELKSLQEQIKPHFLYNTLDTISWMARDHDADNIVRMVDAMTNMFRVGLSHGKDYITVREETTHVSNYLYIQKTRYKDKLNYRIDVEREIANFMVPKLILQPLVENAIYHGIKQKRGGGTIVVTGRLIDRMLCLSVEDDGAGIEPERLQILRKQLAEPVLSDEKQSFGLPYIAERLRLCYGESGRLTLEGAPGMGAKATITIPARDTAPSLNLSGREHDHV